MVSIPTSAIMYIRSMNPSGTGHVNGAGGDRPVDCDRASVFTDVDRAARQPWARPYSPAGRHACAQPASSLRDVEVLAVGLGPGSYTGLRVGLTAAKTLAYATGAPLIGLDSLEAIARNAPASAARISVVADAQRGQVYVAEFVRRAPSTASVSRPSRQIEPLAAWLARLEPGTLVLGPAWIHPASATPLPAGLADSRSRAQLSRRSPLDRAGPRSLGQRPARRSLAPRARYLRHSSAEEQWDRPQIRR